MQQAKKKLGREQNKFVMEKSNKESGDESKDDLLALFLLDFFSAKLFSITSVCLFFPMPTTVLLLSLSSYIEHYFP